MFRFIIHISLTSLLIFSILAPSFIELVSDIDMVEIADTNDKENQLKLKKDKEEKIIQYSELEENLDILNKNKNTDFYYLRKHTNMLSDVLSPPPEATI
jgi:hypothetical protein